MALMDRAQDQGTDGTGQGVPCVSGTTVTRRVVR
jgi:hypothetical protein